MDKTLAVTLCLFLVVSCVVLRPLAVRGAELTLLGHRIAALTRLSPASSRILFYLSGFATIAFGFLFSPKNVQPVQLFGLCLSLLVMMLAHISIIRWRSQEADE